MENLAFSYTLVVQFFRVQMHQQWLLNQSILLNISHIFLATRSAPVSSIANSVLTSAPKSCTNMYLSRSLVKQLKNWKMIPKKR